MDLGERCLTVPTAQLPSLAFLFCERSWKTELIKLFLARRKGAFLDVGANVGTTLLDFLTTGQPVSRYVGFEPNPRCVGYMNDVIKRNDLGACTIAPVGLSDAHQLMKLHLLPNRQMDSAGTLMASLRPNEAFETVWVPCFRFDDLREALGIKEIALIKVDVEGAELEALRGMSESIASAKPIILCEVLYADQHAAECLYTKRLDLLRDLIHSLGYAIWHIEKTTSGAVESLTKFASFPFRRWTPETSEESDYVFIPSAEEALLENLGFKMHR